MTNPPQTKVIVEPKKCAAIKCSYCGEVGNNKNNQSKWKQHPKNILSGKAQVPGTSNVVKTFCC